MELENKIQSIFPEEKDIPRQFKLTAEVIQKEYLVNGELRSWDGPMHQALSPICIRDSSTVQQKPLGHFPLLTEEESLGALGAAINAYDNGRGPWPTMSVEDRIKYVEEFAYRMKEKRDEVVRLLMWEIGKSYRDSEKEFDRTLDYIRDTIEALKELDRLSSRFVIKDGVIGQIRRAPLGVALCMGPYNYPLNETFTTLIPALIMGNTVIFKPARRGTLILYPLLEAFQTSFPRGVVNSVYGDGRKVIKPLMESGKISSLAFIGSSKAASELRSQHPALHRLRCTLGLDAKNAAIVLPDADLDLAVRECISGTLAYNGQRCTSLKILFVYSQIIDAFLEHFVEAVTKLKFGMPWEPDVSLTPLPGLDMINNMVSLVEDAKEHGAKIMNEAGGTVNETFFYPAILYPVNPEMRIYREEQFGPVIPVLPFDKIETPLRYIIESNYGQQVSIFGGDAKIIASLIDPLVNQVCRVNINSQCQRGPDSFPFTGRKDSAQGTLSVFDALRAFSIRTVVAAKQTALNRELITKIVRERESNFLSTDYIL